MDEYTILYKDNDASNDITKHWFKTFADNSGDALLKFFEKYGKKWRIIDVFIIDCNGVLSSVYDNGNNDCCGAG